MAPRRQLEFTRYGRPSIAIVIASAVLLFGSIARGEGHGSGVKPFFLIAARDMPDPLFQQSVIVMLPHEEMPIVAGIIVNRPTDIEVGKLIGAAPAGDKAVAYFGGPVSFREQSAIVRTSRPPDDATWLFDDLYLSSDADAIAKLIGDPGSHREVRVFLGRAQWTPDQLQGEIAQGFWYVVRAKAEQVFSADPEKLWRDLVKTAELREVKLDSPPISPQWPPKIERSSGVTCAAGLVRIFSSCWPTS